jgi:hypothetical protein
VLTLALTWWCLWAGVQRLAPSGVPEYTSIRLAWLGVATAPTAYLIFGLEYVNTGLKRSRAWLVLLSVEPVIIVLAVGFNPWLQLMWATTLTATGADVVPVLTGRGPLWTIHLTLPKVTFPLSTFSS